MTNPLPTPQVMRPGSNIAGIRFGWMLVDLMELACVMPLCWLILKGSP